MHQGYAGLIGGDFRQLTARSVGGIIQLGGTVLGSARAPEFKTEEGRMKALWELGQQEIEAVVIIGGNGSQTGACALSQMGFPVVGVASTIDNDLVGSDITIGVDTAMNIALEAFGSTEDHRRFAPARFPVGSDGGATAVTWRWKSASPAAPRRSSSPRSRRTRRKWCRSSGVPMNAARRTPVP